MEASGARLDVAMTVTPRLVAPGWGGGGGRPELGVYK